MKNKSNNSIRRRLLCLAPIAASFALPLSANAAIVGYHEVGGGYQSTWGGSGNLVGDSFDGKNFSEVTSAQFFGAENGFFRLIDSGGRNVYYPLHTSTDHQSWAGNNNITALPNGPLEGLPLKNDKWIGATNDVNYYLEDNGTLVRYFDWGTFVMNFDHSWTTFSGGRLDGMSISDSLSLGLNDFGGGNAMNENWFVIIEEDGTHGYYNLDNGQYASALSAGGYGNWTAFSDGPLDGLSLSFLKDNPTGVHNGQAYRFLGTSIDGMYFDVNLVPEPGAALLSLVGALGLLARRRR